MSVATPGQEQSREAPSRAPRIVVIIVTYGGAEDAIESIASLLQSTHASFKIILCDNASPDGTLARVRAFARGEKLAQLRPGCPIAIDLPAGAIDHVELDADAPFVDIAALPRLSLVDTKANRGYAGGNNVALRWLQANPDWDYGWILNPDTVVDRGAMAALVAHARGRPQLGPIGARMCFYDDPQRIEQWGGGRFRRLRASGLDIGVGRPASYRPVPGQVEREMTYVVGSSFFFPRAFLDTVGLMDERYFLYFEEVDWCRRRGDFALGYAHDAIVYHKCGASIGSSISRKKVSPLALYWTFRNRYVYTWKFDPWALPAVYLWGYYDVLRFILIGSWRGALIVLRTMHGLPSKGTARPPSAQP
jgi:hypothetical protein